MVTIFSGYPDHQHLASTYACSRWRWHPCYDVRDQFALTDCRIPSGFAGWLPLVERVEGHRSSWATPDPWHSGGAMVAFALFTRAGCFTAGHRSDSRCWKCSL